MENKTLFFYYSLRIRSLHCQHCWEWIKYSCYQYCNIVGYNLRQLCFLQLLLLQPFYGSLDYVRDNPDEPVPEGTFRHLLDFLVQNEDNTGRCTNNLDGLPPDPD